MLEIEHQIDVDLPLINSLSYPSTPFVSTLTINIKISVYMAENTPSSEFDWDIVVFKVCNHFSALINDRRYHSIELCPD
jgi:hypothetical protein